MNETWVTMSGTNSLAVEAGAVSIRPGLGRHELCVPVSLRPTDSAPSDQTISLGGRIDATMLVGGGYLGTAHRTRAQRLSVNGRIEQYMCVDLQPGQIEAIEQRRSGGFALNIHLEVLAERPNGLAEEGGATITNHPVTREQWLTILEQIKYRQTMLLELTVPDAQTSPHLTEAIGYFADAQRRSLEGEWRLTVESLRQALAALVGKKAEDEDDVDAVTASLKMARDQTRSGAVGYPDRFELARQTLKFLTDLGAHPEVAETTPTAARSALTVVAGLLHWYSTVRPQPPG